MATGKIRNLQVRPLQSADLAFEIPGVIGFQDMGRARLGARLKPFDIEGLGTRLSTTVANNPGRSAFDDTGIHAALRTQCLFQLRNEVQQAQVRSAVAQREMLYLERHKHKDAIVAAYSKLYPRQVAADAKLARLSALKRLIEEQRAELQKAYAAQQWTGVVSEVKTTSEQKGTLTASTRLTPLAMKNTGHNIAVTGAAASNHAIPDVNVIPLAYQGGWKEQVAGELSIKSQETVTANDIKESTATKGPEFRHPRLENLIGEQRGQLDLQDELLEHELFAQRVPELGLILDRELEATDAELKRQQARLVQSYLVPPFAGIVTAVYKDIGEAVQPGEPVLRLENDDRILMVGIVQCREALRVDRKVRIRTGSVYESSDTLAVDGAIVAVRGHTADDDEWDLVIEAANNLQVPINYSFDKDTTTIEFV